VDFHTGRFKTDLELVSHLSVCDLCEINLRDMAAYVFERRTKDRAAAQKIRALATPGSQSDVAPTWLLTEAMASSRVEHQQRERVSTDLRRRQQQTEAKGKGKGKDGKGKKDKQWKKKKEDDSDG
jgi:hypothetical protein